MTRKLSLAKIQSQKTIGKIEIYYKISENIMEYNIRSDNQGEIHLVA